MHMVGELKTDFALVHLHNSYSVNLEPYLIFNNFLSFWNALNSCIKNRTTVSDSETRSTKPLSQLQLKNEQAVTFWRPQLDKARPWCWDSDPLYRAEGLSGFPPCHAPLWPLAVATSAPRGRHLAQRRRKHQEGMGNNKNGACVSHCALHQSTGSKASTGLPPWPNHQALVSRWNKYIKLWGIIKMTDDWVSSEIRHY